MIQQITAWLSALRLADVLQINRRTGNWGLAWAAVLGLACLHAAPNHPDYRGSEGPLPAAKPSAAIHRLAPAGDTSITETICANGFYVFNGDTLRDPGQYSAVLVAADGTDSIVALDLIVLPVSTGMDTVTICAGSTYEFNGEVLSQPGVYESVFAGANGCDSTVTLTLYVLPNSLTKFQAGICTGSSYIFQGDTLTESGFYSVVFPAANGCDSIVILTLDVVPFFDVQLKASICAGENFVFNGDTLHAAGSYTDSLQAAGGCDSIVTLTLKVLPVPTTELTAGICTGSEYHFQGDTLEVSGTYRDTLTAANGCDSLVILHLSVVDFFDVSLNVSICTGETYVFGADSLDTEGVYVHSLVAAGGCDSTVTLALTILPVQTGTAAATICQGDTLDYNGQLLTIADVYKIILTGANGCDSTVTLTLTVKPTAATALQATICQGAIYDFNGEALDSAGTYTAVLDAANGCDSTVTLQLTVLPVQQTNIPATICPGGAYPYNGDLLTATGNYPYVFVGANGCDSIVTIALTVLASPNTELNVSICSGDGYIFNGSFYTQTGTYTAIFTAVNGCDSTATLHLEVLPVQNTSLSASICVGTDYIFHGDTLDQSGVYTGVFTGGNGCDSTVTLSLTVLPTHSSTLTAITCANEPYLYNGQSYMTSGTYPIVLTGPNGCDSTVTLVLTVRPVFASAFSASICAGEVYLYNGDTLTASGTFTYFLHAVTGCDSVVTLQLTVRPLPSSHATVNLCQGGAYVFDGDTLTTSGTYVATHPGANGCDSTATLELNFAPFFALSVQATICNGEGYLFGGDSLHTEGIYVDSLLAGGGCDSIVTLTLTVLPVKETTTVATICSGGSYQFNGQAYTQSGLYPVKLIGVNGCDSTVTLNLIVLPVPVTNLAATICAGETYPFNGNLLSASGSYTATLSGSNGCDSLVVLSLTVLPEQIGSLAFTVCPGEVLAYNGDTLTLSGTYQFTLPGAAANGCDSVILLTLTVLPAIPFTETNDTICEGTPYDFYGMPLSAAGIYIAHLPGANGCDSIILLDLAVLPKASTQLDVDLCAGESYSFNGQNLSATGIYTAQLQASNGCDSIVTLTLLVNTVNTSVSVQNGTLTSSAFNASYQWINCNGLTPIVGATGSSYTPTVTGQYAVVVTQNGCSDTSVCQLVQVIATFEPLAESSWNVQPNPAHQQAAVVFKEPLLGQIRLEIYDPAGRLMQKQTVATGTSQADLDLSGLPNGLLLVRLVSAQGTSTKRLMKAEN